MDRAQVVAEHYELSKERWEKQIKAGQDLASIMDTATFTAFRAFIKNSIETGTKTVMSKSTSDTEAVRIRTYVQALQDMDTWFDQTISSANSAKKQINKL